MRTGLLAAALLLTAATPAPAADPPLPPVVFQVQPAGQFIDALRASADAVGGEPGVKALNRFLKALYGEKGLDGLDLNRPIVGYVVLAPKLEDFTAVVAFPVSDEADFIALCDRANRDKVKPDEKDKGLYHVPSVNPKYKALMRFSDQYAYLAYGVNPAPHAAADALVPMAKLYDPADRALASGRLYFDRVPLAVKLALPALFEEVKKSVLGDGPAGVGRAEAEVLKAVTAGFEKLAVRYALLAAGADVLTVRLDLDPKAGNFVAEAVLTPKPGTELAKLVAAYKTAPNRFAAVLDHPDTVAAVVTRAPLFAPEIRTAAAEALEGAGKAKAGTVPEVDKAWTDELFKGLARTAKNKDWDAAVALRGPDKDGWFTVVGVAAFDDATKLGKEAKASWEKDAPKDRQERMKWDADSFGKVGIHTYHWETGGFVDFTKFLGGEKCYGAFAFGPDFVVGAIGPDPVAVIKDVLGAKPAPAKAMDARVNPAKAVKAFEKAAPNEREVLEISNLLGREDKLLSAMSVEVTGGKELKAAFTVNLKLLPRLMFKDAIDDANRDPEPKPEKSAPDDKK